ncbi:S16 family serine protease [Paenibacillus sp. HB172176]|uniref:S16 family serine protease n=1 Tax=Paenibacillus sp. HB172176 TaxID=2493690 RepID=UPI00143C5510|nr:S16 family serine protease [Paenibacillus sp. HB172176]
MKEGTLVARRSLLSAALTAFLMWLLLYAPTPLVLYKPGIAAPVNGMIAMQDGEDVQSEGKWLLTAVKLTDTNVWGALKAAFDSKVDVYRRKDVFQGLSQQQYAERVSEVMKESQSEAVEAAYRYVGISYSIVQGKVTPEQTEQTISISAGEIGGPSAGLVFALAAVDLLTEGDMTAGERIAATGTITTEGRVGAIGGIKQKVVSTSEEGAQLFLVPKENEKAARKEAKAIGSSMKIVGVGSLKEAIAAIASFAETH